MTKQKDDVAEKSNVLYIGHKDLDGRIQPLKKHLENVGHLTREFANQFHEGELGEVIGSYHDIGKYSKPFQTYIKAGGGRKVDHSTAGMKELWKVGMIPAAFCVAGHHGGLPDKGGKCDMAEGRTLIAKSKRTNIPDYHDFLKENNPIQPVKPSPFLMELAQEHDPFSFMTYIRMLFSCLVDADFLDTEEFMSNGQVRRGGFDDVSILKQRLDEYIQKNFSHPVSTMNRKRCKILQQCQDIGDRHEGNLFNLTVPTGGGKTIASLAFALHHAVRDAKRYKQRIIYVIPYTSIIEQNADVFRKILGDGNVVEHHMNVAYDDSEDEAMNRKKLATENWDAPVIVTTNVQFFESLFANRTSKCRKLHNIVNSVIIFDEAQMIPLDFLKPCMKIIDELTRYYHCTAVLCTATQPSLEKFFPKQKMLEICPNIVEDYQFFKRTTIRIHKSPVTEAELSEQLRNLEQVLCIVNTKKKARQLYENLAGEGVYHLSTNLYPAHRIQVFAEIKKRLQSGLPCKVIATSLMECGVDLSFPTVYRELAGLDSIIQAAGRCNREGKAAAEDSIVHVFEIDAAKANSNTNRYCAVTKAVYHEYPEDISIPAAIRSYFNQLHILEGNDLDKKNILDSSNLQACPFEKIAQEFVLINTPTTPILIPYTEEADCIAQRLRNGERSRALMRQVGMYSVNVYFGSIQQPYEKLFGAGKIEKLDEGISILLDMAQYDEKTGLDVNIEEGQDIFM